MPTKPTEPTEPAEPTEEPPGDDMIWSTDAVGIRAAMDEVRPAIAECYSAWAKENPELAGKLVVSFTIESESPEGEQARVTAVSIPKSEVDHPLLEGCVLNAVVGLRFAGGGEPITVTYPFRFSNPPDEAAEE